jgi:hypothetical protein
MIDKTIRGLQEAQRWNARAIANMRPSDKFGRLIQTITTQLQRQEIAITHVDTGALRASERMEINGLRGRIFIDQNARNPRSGVPTHVYAVFENARGGEHAFAERAARDIAPRIVNQALAYFGPSLT